MLRELGGELTRAAWLTVAEVVFVCAARLRPRTDIENFVSVLISPASKAIVDHDLSFLESIVISVG